MSSDSDEILAVLFLIRRLTQVVWNSELMVVGMKRNEIDLVMFFTSTATAKDCKL